MPGATRRTSHAAVLLLVATSWRTAAADSWPSPPALRLASAAPTDLLTIPAAEAMPDWSAAATLVAQYLHPAATETRPRLHGLALDALLAASLGGRVLVAARAPMRAALIEDAGGGIDVAGPVVPSLGLDARLVLRRRGRDRIGPGVALLFSLDLSTASWRPALYRPGLAVDLGLGWLHLGAYVSVPFHPAREDTPPALRIDHGGGVSLHPCSTCGLSIGLGVDGSVPLTGADSGKDAVTRGLAWLGWRVPDSRLTARCFVAMPLDGDRLARAELVAGAALSWDFGDARDAHGYPIPDPIAATPRSARSARSTAFPSSDSGTPTDRPSAPAAIASPTAVATPRAPRFAGPGVPAGPVLVLDPRQSLRDAADAIELANQRYLPSALAARGLETLQEILVNTAAGLALTTVLMGTTYHYALSVRLTVLFLQWIGVGSLALLGSERANQIQAAFEPFLATVVLAGGDKAMIDRAARQYADAVALVCSAGAEMLFYVGAAKGVDFVLKHLEGSRLAREIGIQRIRAWLQRGARQVEQQRAATSIRPASRPAQAPNGLTPNQKGKLGQDWSRTASKARGEVIVGGNVDLIFTIRGRRVAIRADFLVQTPEPNVYNYIESKYSPRASYQKNQRIVIPELVKAGDAGLPAVVGVRAGRLKTGGRIVVRFQGDIWTGKPVLLGDE